MWALERANPVGERVRVGEGDRPGRLSGGAGLPLPQRGAVPEGAHQVVHVVGQDLRGAGELDVTVTAHWSLGIKEAGQQSVALGGAGARVDRRDVLDQ